MGGGEGGRGEGGGSVNLTSPCRNNYLQKAQLNVAFFFFSFNINVLFKCHLEFFIIFSFFSISYVNVKQLCFFNICVKAKGPNLLTLKDLLQTFL